MKWKSPAAPEGAANPVAWTSTPSLPSSRRPTTTSSPRFTRRPSRTHQVPSGPRTRQPSIRGSRGIVHVPSGFFTYVGRLVVAKNPSGSTPSCGAGSVRAGGAAARRADAKSGGRYRVRDPRRWRAIGSDDPLAERAERELNGEFGGAVLDIQHGIHLDDVKAGQTPAVGEQLHGEVRFAIRHPPWYGRADSGGVGWVNHVEVERRPDGGGVARRGRDRFRHHGPHAPLVNCPHGPGRNRPLRDVLTLGVVEIADSHERDVAGAHGGGGGETGEGRVAVAQ